MSVSSCENISISERIRRESARGEFAYWQPEHEAEWRAEAPPRPEPFITDFATRVIVVPNQLLILRRHDEYGEFAAVIECGKSYLVGRDVATADFIANHTTKLTGWKKPAYAWAVANPLWKLTFDQHGLSWHVNSGGKYVEFALPYHDAGGEKNWISQSGKTLVLVNVD